MVGKVIGGLSTLGYLRRERLPACMIYWWRAIMIWVEFESLFTGTLVCSGFSECMHAWRARCLR